MYHGMKWVRTQVFSVCACFINAPCGVQVLTPEPALLQLHVLLLHRHLRLWGNLLLRSKAVIIPNNPGKFLKKFHVLNKLALGWKLKLVQHTCKPRAKLLRKNNPFLNWGLYLSAEAKVTLPLSVVTFQVKKHDLLCRRSAGCSICSFPEWEAHTWHFTKHLSPSLHDMLPEAC